MRDFTYPVVAGMFILGVLMILAATTSANAASQNLLSVANPTASPVAGNGNAYQASSEIRLLVQREANLQMEIQRSTAIHSQAEQSRASAGKKIKPGCVLCKID